MNQNQRKALNAEKITQLHLQRKGYCLLKHRWKTPWAELDLVMQNLDEYLIVEVKCWAPGAHLEFRVSQQQKKRLFNAQLALESRWQVPVRPLLALVNESEQVFFYHLFDGIEDQSLSFSLRKSLQERL